jgi:hypothetical protein
MEVALERALKDDGAWADLVGGRREQLRQFLRRSSTGWNDDFAPTGSPNGMR